MEMRWSVAKSTCTLVVLLMVGSSAGCASTARPPAAVDRSPGSAVGFAPAAQATSIPGTDPAIQRWFLSSGAIKVAFNDALLRAERGVASSNAAECRPLDAAARALSVVLPKLAALSQAGQKLAAAIQPPITTFGTAAQACLAKNFPGAQTSLEAGIVQQADAQATVDEILDGDL
jgi:hypothetical protein